MTAVDAALTDMMGAVFAEYRDRHNGPACSDAEFLRQLGDLGLVRLTGDVQRGGSGASWWEAAELQRAAVHNGVRTPLAEHDLLACWLLETIGLDTGDALRTVCVLEDGHACAVPWAAWSQRLVLVWREGESWRVADADSSDIDIVPGVSIAGEPRDSVSADTTQLNSVATTDSVIGTLFLRGALVRAIQVCAALERVLDLTVSHAADRIQFGRPLSRFQAVQHLVADIAAETALARASTDAALADVEQAGWDDPRLAFRIAAARSCAGHAASVVVRNAHQVVGAIGTTREHRLHEFTNAALAWRSEFGSLHHWDDALTELAMATGCYELWSLIAP